MATLTDNHSLIPIPGRDGLWHILARTVGTGGDAWCHIVPGTEKALLIDTGFGCGDLKGMAEALCDKEIIVVNTHNHGDHTGGNCQFERVYIHRLDAPALYESMKTGGRALPEEGTYFYASPEDVVKPKDYEVVAIEDGHVFDLGGGYEVEVFHLPGHAAGGIGLLDRKRRAVFTGDALVWTPTFCMSRPGVPVTPYMTVEKFRDGVARLCEHLDEFDVLYPGHSHLGLSKQLVPDMLACCDELLAGDLSAQETVPMRGNPVHVHGMAKIAFTEDRIWVK